MMSHDGVVTLISHGGCAAMRASYRALSTHGYKMGLESFRKNVGSFSTRIPRNTVRRYPIFLIMHLLGIEPITLALLESCNTILYKIKLKCHIFSYNDIDCWMVELDIYSQDYNQNQIWFPTCLPATMMSLLGWHNFIKCSIFFKRGKIMSVCKMWFW